MARPYVKKRDSYFAGRLPPRARITTPLLISARRTVLGAVWKRVPSRASVQPSRYSSLACSICA